LENQLPKLTLDVKIEPTRGLHHVLFVLPILKLQPLFYFFYLGFCLSNIQKW